MNLKEAIKIHNELQDTEEIKRYTEALNIVVKNINKKERLGTVPKRSH